MGKLLRTRTVLIRQDLPRIQQLARNVSSCHLREHPNAIRKRRGRIERALGKDPSRILGSSLAKWRRLGLAGDADRAL